MRLMTELGEELPDGFGVVFDPNEEVDDLPTYTEAGPVKITRSNGTIEVRESYTSDELSAILKNKHRRPAATSPVS